MRLPYPEHVQVGAIDDHDFGLVGHGLASR